MRDLLEVRVGDGSGVQAREEETISGTSSCSKGRTECEDEHEARFAYEGGEGLGSHLRQALDEMKWSGMGLDVSSTKCFHLVTAARRWKLSLFWVPRWCCHSLSDQV